MNVAKQNHWEQLYNNINADVWSNGYKTVMNTMNSFLPR